MSNQLSVSHEVRFNAAHQLYLPEWSDEKNKSVFGKCANPHYHGHNYRLIVTISGNIDSHTGRIYNVRQLHKIIHKYIVLPFDHKNLNLNISYFENKNPTAENIALTIWDLLRPHIEKDYHLKILLYETEKNFVAYPTN